VRLNLVVGVQSAARENGLQNRQQALPGSDKKSTHAGIANTKTRKYGENGE
jgi:hypothetical protein